MIYLCATWLLKTNRDDDGIPISPSYDYQLRVIIVGEAGVGKSHVLQVLMYFVFQYGWVESTVVTTYQDVKFLIYEILPFVEWQVACHIK